MPGTSSDSSSTPCYATANGTAQASSDYTAKGGVLTFAADMSSVCPPGYARNSAYCVPAAGQPKPALPRVSSVCPPGYYRSGAYGVQNAGQ